jgi:hypothetical protein
VEESGGTEGGGTRSWVEMRGGMCRARNVSCYWRVFEVLSLLEFVVNQSLSTSGFLVWVCSLGRIPSNRLL